MSQSWFYVEGKEKVGPVNQEVLVKLILEGRVMSEAFVWRKGLENWTKVKDVPEMKIYLGPRGELGGGGGASPQEDAAEALITPAAPDWDRISHTARILTVKQAENGNIYGPFSMNMLVRLFQEKRLNGKSFIFTPGMETWTFLAEMPFYQDLFSETPPTLEEDERRRSTRRPFVAKMFFHDHTKLFEGVCRDISLGGMQVLVSNFPGKKGDAIALNVHPENSRHHFVASGKVGRLLDGDQGVFILFTELGDEARHSIQTYLEEER